ncbi:RHS repeat-associated core domain-containing protein [Bacteroides sedimenti]
MLFNQCESIEKTNPYIPFGMTFGEGITTSDQRYKYNGKELDRIHCLNLYDYGARHYDAVIGRWETLGPLAEKYYSISPYVYCVNNPIRYIDPNGNGHIFNL